MTIADQPWLILILTLPAANTAARMRAWRALKALGCASLRDGVYLLPSRTELDYQLRNLATEVQQAGGQGWVLQVSDRPRPGQASFAAMFDRGAPYAELCRQLDIAMLALPGQPAAEVARSLRRLRKELDNIRATDYFPSEASTRAEAAWLRFGQAAEAAMSVGEPVAALGEVALLDRSAYQGRHWVTRKRMWVDRVACAWLIRRFIDETASFSWLDTTGECPPGALGFDFDGAAFSHVGERVTFEVLLAGFGLASDPALARLGAMVHQLDMGGGYVPEAVGFEALMRGARKRGLNDHRLLEEIGAVLDSLYADFSDGDEDGE